MVCTGSVSDGKVIRLMREAFKASFETSGSDGVMSAGNEGSPVLSLAQNASQNS